ncbi:hypothetical protein PQR67_35640 [Paraburkholderia fungorum]|uniref:hypothetical protein n=1 Tax=Paraburkholderia fungorum TaxID=134537 RepID=UPI0038BA5140
MATSKENIMLFGGQILFDAYDRKARLAPALLAVAPLLTAAVLSFDNVTLLGRLATLLIAIGGLWLLADMSRGLGRAKERKLFARWGGMPSLQLIRHSDPLLDAHTKARYHACLQSKAKVKFPSASEEAADPIDADERYSSALKWLLQHTRDKKRFPLLSAENATYGFRRNGYGVRWIGFTICVAAASWSLGAAALHADVSVLLSLVEPRTAIQLVLCLVFALVWLVYFREPMVRDAAFTYAHELLRCCEVIAAPSSSRRPKGDSGAPIRVVKSE